MLNVNGSGADAMHGFALLLHAWSWDTVLDRPQCRVQCHNTFPRFTSTSRSRHTESRILPFLRFCMDYESYKRVNAPPTRDRPPSAQWGAWAISTHEHLLRTCRTGGAHRVASGGDNQTFSRLLRQVLRTLASQKKPCVMRACGYCAASCNPQYHPGLPSVPSGTQDKQIPFHVRARDSSASGFPPQASLYPNGDLFNKRRLAVVSQLLEARPEDASNASLAADW